MEWLTSTLNLKIGSWMAFSSHLVNKLLKTRKQCSMLLEPLLIASVLESSLIFHKFVVPFNGDSTIDQLE